MPYVEVVSISLKFSRTYSYKCDAVSMSWVNICMDLENKAAEFIFMRNDFAQLRMPCFGNRSDVYKAIQQFLHSKIVYSATKENRSQLSFQVIVDVKFRVDAFYQFYIFS